MTVADSPVQCDVLVGSISASRPTAFCSPDDTLDSASNLLQSTGRTAAIIENGEKTVLGVLTENDMLLAFVEGTASSCTVGQWLHGGEDIARLPNFLVPPLSLQPDVPLMEAAARMAVMTNGDFACHHLLVDPGDTDRNVALLSALDIARGLLVAASAHVGDQALEVARLAVTHAMKVSGAEVMKVRQVARSTLADSLGDALDLLHSSNQNCVLAIPTSTEDEGQQEEEGDQVMEHAIVGGAITPGDALRAISERVNCRSLSLGKWLHKSGISPEHRFISSESSLADAAVGTSVFKCVQSVGRCVQSQTGACTE
ncbi:unnamed protein product [Symbiodinium necroappetens]|uniref:CBS domain-containing protein n=1 Tax=Symbiodinium necroappetens TaxID=1628268 RepID=A0A812ISY6_9DINO|nr:unnamed protein product [Symbiodinium necroappetens]